MSASAATRWLEIERSVVDILESMGRWRDALTHMQALQPRLAARFGANSWEDVSARVTWATAHAGGGQHAEAGAAILRALEPQLAQAWPERGYGAAALRADVGYVQWEARAWADAEHSLTSAISDLDRLLGPRNNPAIKGGRTLGMVYMDSGAYQRAAETFADNLTRSRAFYGPDDGETGAEPVVSRAGPATHRAAVRSRDGGPQLPGPRAGGGDVFGQ